MTQGRKYTVLVALIVALGGFVWGFDATVISGAVPFIQKYFDLAGDRGDFLLGLAVSCLGWGVLGGTAVAGFFSDRFGRKKVLITTAVFFTGSALLSALTTNFALFVFSRILGGMAVGGAILIAPVYIAEISPPQLRGQHGFAQSAHDRAGHLGLLLLQLLSPGRGAEQLALDAGHGCRSGRPVFLPALCRAGEPALAVWQGPDGAGQGDSDQDLRSRRRRSRSCVNIRQSFAQKAPARRRQRAVQPPDELHHVHRAGHRLLPADHGHQRDLLLPAHHLRAGRRRHQRGVQAGRAGRPGQPGHDLCGHPVRGSARAASRCWSSAPRAWRCRC